MKPAVLDVRVWLPAVLAAAIASSHARPAVEPAAPPRPRAMTLPQLRGLPSLAKPTTFELLPDKSSVWRTTADRTLAIEPTAGELFVDEAAHTGTLRLQGKASDGPIDLQLRCSDFAPGRLPGLWRIHAQADSPALQGSGWLCRLPGSPVRLQLLWTQTVAGQPPTVYGCELAWKRTSR
jgi:hypothetical protein